MKRFVCITLVLLLVCSSIPNANATETIDFSIVSLASKFISSAYANNEYFNLPNNQEDIYLCNPVNPHIIQNNSLAANEDIEYYLIKMGNKYIACITVCYKNGQPLSASFSTDIAVLVNNSISDEILLVVNDCQIYLKAENGVFFNSDTDTLERNMSVENQMCERIAEISFESQHISVMQKVPIVSTYSSSRASSILNVPYVSQSNYPICWAASAASFGRYYTGSNYSQYTAYDLACMVGVGPNAGSMDDSRSILSSIFKINTTIVSTMSYSQIISKINSGHPILVGFLNSKNAHMVVLCGYDNGAGSSNTLYYVRDSNSTSLQIVVTYASGSIAMDYYSTAGVMYWNEAAYKS